MQFTVKGEVAKSKETAKLSDIDMYGLAMGDQSGGNARLIQNELENGNEISDNLGVLDKSFNKLFEFYQI